MNNFTIKPEQYKDEDIAVIGMAGRFPEADTLEEFWANLAAGRDSVRAFPEQRLQELQEIFDQLPPVNFIRQGYLEQISQFEPEIFGINHEECRVMDPQQRILLELVEEAIADAGYAPSRLAQNEVGIYVTEGENLYTRNFYGLSFMAFVNGLHSAGAGRVAYTYNFRGPAFVISCACSSTLVALHTASESLRRGECEYAIAGGVRLDLFPTDVNQMGAVPILSPDQQARAFDKAANGTIIGEGGAVLILKPVKKALADGDTIHAVIKGSGINSDGNRSSSLNAPSEEGQAEAILKALKQAEIDPKTISYLETHGTGTKIGDPIEIAGMTAALKQFGFPNQSIPIGSLKTNIGHLDTAAGVASVVKTILAMKHRQIPPTLHFTEPNPFIDFEHSPFYVNTQLSDWESNTVRRAGVTSLGLIGTNAHMIIEEAPQFVASPEWPNVVTLSARTRYSLEKMVGTLTEYLQQHPELSVTDIAYTLNSGRRRFQHALALTASSTRELVEKLRAGKYTTYSADDAGKVFENVDGELKAQAGQCGPFSPICIYPAYSEDNLSALTTLFNEEPLKGALARAQGSLANKENLKNPQVQYVLYLYAFSQALEEYIGRSGATLGFGLGETVADLVLGEIGLEEAVQQAMHYQKAMEPILEERLGKVVDSIIEAEYNSFILIMPTAPILGIFGNVLKERAGIDMYTFLPVRGALQEGVIEMLKNGVVIDWQGAYNNQIKRRVNLPGYVFDRQSYSMKIRAAMHANPAALSHSRGEGTSGSTDPHFVAKRLQTYLNEFKPAATTDLEQDFDTLGMDSIALLHFTGKIKQEFGVQIPLSIFFKELSIGQALGEIQKQIVQNTVTVDGPTPQPLDTYLPVAHPQQMLFKMAEANPWNGHIARVWQLEGEVDKPRLEEALKAIILRHEAFRTSFAMVDSQLMQKVHSEFDFHVNYVKAGREIEEKMFETIKPFDLSQTPLLRVTLFEAGKTSYLLYEFPYIIMDAASLHIFANEFGVLYNGGQLPELPIQPKDYTVWHQEQLATEAMQAKGRFWHDVMQDGFNEIRLPLDHQRPEVFSGVADRGEYFIQQLAGPLNELAQNLGVTMNMLLLAAWCLLVSKYSGTDDLTIGTIMGGRTRADVQGLLGHFASVVPMRSYPSDEKTFVSFLAEVKEFSVKALEYQDYPLEILMEELQIKRDNSHGPWFDVTYTYQNAKGREAQPIPKSDINITPYPLDYWNISEDLILVLIETDIGIVVDLRYNPQLFKKLTIKLIKDDYFYLLRTIVENPNATIEFLRRG